MSKTNFNRIKKMTIDELAQFLVKVNSTHAKCRKGKAVCKWEDYPTHDKGCRDCFREWLESEVEE